VGDVVADPVEPVERFELLALLAAFALLAGALDRVVDRSHQEFTGHLVFDEEVLAPRWIASTPTCWSRTPVRTTIGVSRLLVDRLEGVEPLAIGEVQVEQDDIGGRRFDRLEASSRRVFG